MKYAQITEEKKKGFWRKCKEQFWKFFRLNPHTIIKAYTGYGNAETTIIFGHVLTLSPVPRKKYNDVFVYNFLGLLRLFMIKPARQATVTLHWQGSYASTKIERDGFFYFKHQNAYDVAPGRHEAKLTTHNHKGTAVHVTCNVIVPAKTDFALISDIDDTFLVSHSGEILKRLYVLFTENARTRKPFEGAVQHYRLLHCAADGKPGDNAFFYVSSSEWNLYDYISEFVHEYRLPEGVFMLNQIKTFRELLATGQNNHNGKFTRIVKIIELYPEQQFVLLGDDSQKDIDIYTSVVRSFPQNIYAVYLRRVGTPVRPHVLEQQKIIEAAGVKFFYFDHSDKAIAHSKEIGLIK